MYNKKGKMQSDSEKNNDRKTTINASQLLGAGSTRIKILNKLDFYDRNL
ncbi:MAG: hypothetical protein K0R54_4884 [Clostridiaceae bacterium]|jgi:hypothetical protein|nr:hypothetical protein [Clostridiaceae bacterium]